MSRIFMTGFESGSLQGWQATNCSVSTFARTGRYALSINNRGRVHRTLPVATTRIYGRVAVYMSSHASADFGNQFIQFFDSAGNVQTSLSINVNNAIDVRRGSSLSGVTASGGVFTLGEWNVIEFYLSIASSGGIYQVKLNGETVINYTGDTRAASNGTIGKVVLGGTGGTYGNFIGYIDDLVLNDTTGEVNNSWPGQGGIYSIIPVGAGEYTELIPSSGDNYTCVGDDALDETNYVYSVVAGAKDTYLMSNLPEQFTGRIDALQWIAVGKNDLAGDGGFAPLVRINDTDYQGANHGLGTILDVRQEIMELNPATNESWTVNDVNNLEAGVVVY